MIRVLNSGSSFYAGQKDDPTFLLCANYANAILHPPTPREQQQRLQQQKQQHALSVV
jgi:hypothetical protein